MLFALLPLQVAVMAATSQPVEVTLYDANHKETHTVVIRRDGTTDEETRKELRHAFRCRRSGKERSIDPGLLAMIVDVYEHFGERPIEYVSGYRGWSGERSTSPHKAGHAVDFRIEGVKLTEIRDYAWSKFSEVGVGWYPGENFVHVDHREGKPDTAWTEKGGKNHYKPSWSKRVREKRATRAREDRRGV